LKRGKQIVMLARRWFGFIKITLIALLVSMPPAWAQLSSGSITGVVSDPSHAVIPAAKITLTEMDKGLVTNATTDVSGRYLIRSVPTGRYKLTVTAPGFEIETRTNIVLDVNQNVTADFALVVGTSTNAIAVVGESPLLAAEEASTGQVLNRQFIDSMPVIGRDTMGLTYLTPGTVAVLNGPPKTGSAGNDFVSSGGPAWTADVLLDGASVTNYEQNGGLLRVQYLPNPDAIEEFKVQTASFSAEFGFTGSTVVNMVMRSGTNEFHGRAYDYFQNSDLDGNNFFNNLSGTKNPELQRNNFGANVGGPIKKNKAFFFADYDGLKQGLASTTTEGVPSAAERIGNFGELCGYQHGTFNSNGQCSAAAGQLWDPYSGVYSAASGGALRSSFIPFNNLATYTSPGNPNLNGTAFQLAPTAGNLIDPVASKLMQYMPLPNLNVGQPNYQYYNNWIGSGTSPSSNNAFDGKVDYRFSDATTLTGNFGQQRPQSRHYNYYQNVGDTEANGLSNQHSRMAGLHLNHSFSPTLLLTATYGWTRWYQQLPDIFGDYPNVNPITTLGEQAYMGVSGSPTFPAITAGSPYSTGPAGISVGTQGSDKILQGVDSHQGLVTISWVKGSHELRFGGESRWHRVNYYIPSSPGGAFSFTFGSTSQNSTSSSTGGDPLASFLTGVGTGGGSGSYQVPDAPSNANWQWGGFVQDNWKVSRTLTLNIGLRYDLTLPREEAHNRMEWLSTSAVSPLQAPGLGTLHGGEIFAMSGDRANYEPDYSDWEPRFGVAWRPISKTVVRAGYGIYYTASRSAAAGAGGLGQNGFAQTTTWITSLNSDGATPYGRLQNPFPAGGPLLPPGSSQGLLTQVGLAAAGPVKESSGTNKTPYEQSWTLDIQRELPGQILLDVGYVGKKGTHLYFGGDTNLNILPKSVENNTTAQNTALVTFVPNPFYGVITNPASSLSSKTVQAYQLMLPFPQFTTFGGDSPPYANSSYQGLQVRVEKRFSAGLQFLLTYTFSKAIDDASVSQDSFNTGATSLQDPNNLEGERAVSLFDITHVLQFNHVYELPFGRGKKFGQNWNPVLNGVLGGWQVSGIWTINSGLPLSFKVNGGVALPTYGAQRPNLLCTPSRNTGPNWISAYFANNACFAKPANYTLGDAPRNLSEVRTEGQANTNLALSKSFSLSRIRERMRLQVMAQAQNGFNHPLLAAPNTTVGSSAFGIITSQANTPRQLELALKLHF
jgi:hypothetical protein